MIESSHRAEIGLMQSQKWMNYGRKKLNDQSQNIDINDHLLGPKEPLFNYMADLTACGSRSMVTEKEPFFVSNNAIMRQANQIITTTVKLDDY